MHIGTTIAMSGAVSDEDRQYLAYLVATKAGISTDEAKQRVNTFIQSVKDASEQAKAVVDEARKSAATAALYTALALLIGAFIASVSAAIGGRLRDEHL
jgi:Flp pilus assembly protein TadB